MRLKIDVVMDYQLSGGDPALLILEASHTSGQTVLSSTLNIDGASLHRIDGDSAEGPRLWAFVPHDRLRLRYGAEVQVTRADPALDTLAADPLPRLPADVVTYLRPSRHCPSDLFTGFVARRFGHLAGGAKVAAIRDWVAEELVYAPGNSTASTTAMDTFVAREGVCRDYTHLVCSLLRAANIPARYTAVYGPDVHPADFHAVTEVWLEGAWHMVDATGMGRASGLVVIRAGRDASDVAFLETQNWAQLIEQSVTVCVRAFDG